MHFHFDGDLSVDDLTTFIRMGHTLMADFAKIMADMTILTDELPKMTAAIQTLNVEVTHIVDLYQALKDQLASGTIVPQADLDALDAAILEAKTTVTTAQASIDAMGEEQLPQRIAAFIQAEATVVAAKTGMDAMAQEEPQPSWTSTAPPYAR